MIEDYNTCFVKHKHLMMESSLTGALITVSILKMVRTNSMSDMLYIAYLKFLYLGVKPCVGLYVIVYRASVSNHLCKLMFIIDFV